MLLVYSDTDILNQRKNLTFSLSILGNTWLEGQRQGLQVTPNFVFLYLYLYVISDWDNENKLNNYLTEIEFTNVMENSKILTT